MKESYIPMSKQLFKMYMSYIDPYTIPDPLDVAVDKAFELKRLSEIIDESLNIFEVS